MPSYTAAFRDEVIRKVLSTDRTDSIVTISENINIEDWHTKRNFYTSNMSARLQRKNTL